MTPAEIKDLNMKFLQIVVKKGKDTEELHPAKFIFLYENVMPEAYRVSIATIGRYLRSLLPKGSRFERHVS